MTAVVLGLAGAACGEPADCGPNFAEGEQARITVLREDATSEYCGILFLAPDDTFVVTAGALARPNDGCRTRAAASGIPEFGAGVLTWCTPRTAQLGSLCTGRTLTGCNLRVVTEISPYIAPSAPGIDEAQFIMRWNGDTCLTTGCTDRYQIRVERL